LDGKTTTNDFLGLWDEFAHAEKSGLVDLRMVTEFLTREEIEDVALAAKQIPPCPIAFLCNRDAIFGCANMLAALCELPGGCGVFRERREALNWLRTNT